MTSAFFIVHGRLPGLNEIIAKAQSNRFGYGHFKKKETTRCAYAALAGSVPTFATQVDVMFRWVEPNRRRDPDNIRVGSKFILDALVELKKLPGDGKRWIRTIVDEFPDPDPKNPRVEIKIMETGHNVDPR